MTPSVCFPDIDNLTAASCSALSIRDSSTRSGMYYINPQGLSSSPLVQVYCNMTSKDGVGVTEIGHDHESRTLVVGYEEPGSYKRNIKYVISIGTYYCNYESVQEL